MSESESNLQPGAPRPLTEHIAYCWMRRHWGWNYRYMLRSLVKYERMRRERTMPDIPMHPSADPNHWEDS